MATSSISDSREASAFSESLFYDLLLHINPSINRVEALTRLALRHLSDSTETWAALRQALVEQPPAAHRDDRHRALWALVDSLMKHCPHVFVPLMAPRLPEYVAQLIPWERLDWRQPADLWWEAMVLSWAAVLPADGFAPIRQLVVRHKSQAQLHGALEGKHHAAGADPNEAAAAADMERLQEDWKALQVFCASRARDIQRQQQRTALEELLAGEGRAAEGGERRVTAGKEDPAAAAASAGRHGEEEAGSDDDYVPEYMPGAKPRALPDLGLPTRRRREARRRPREDYDL